MTGLFVLYLAVMYMIILEIVKHITITYNLGDLADWVSAIGTMLAVITSIYLANRKRKPFLVFYTHFEPKYTGKGAENMRDNYDFLIVGITNYSDHPVVLVPKRHSDILNVQDALFINEYQSKTHSRAVHITEFSEIDNKLFMLQDNLTGKKYYFAIKGEKDNWKIVYPLIKIDILRRMINDRIS